MKNIMEMDAAHPHNRVRYHWTIPFGFTNARNPIIRMINNGGLIGYKEKGQIQWYRWSVPKKRWIKHSRTSSPYRSITIKAGNHSFRKLRNA